MKKVGPVYRAEKDSPTNVREKRETELLPEGLQGIEGHLRIVEKNAKDGRTAEQNEESGDSEGDRLASSNKWNERQRSEPMELHIVVEILRDRQTCLLGLDEISHVEDRCRPVLLSTGHRFETMSSRKQWSVTKVRSQMNADEHHEQKGRGQSNVPMNIVKNQQSKGKFPLFVHLLHEDKGGVHRQVGIANHLKTQVTTPDEKLQNIAGVSRVEDYRVTDNHPDQREDAKIVDGGKRRLVGLLLRRLEDSTKGSKCRELSEDGKTRISLQEISGGQEKLTLTVYRCLERLNRIRECSQDHLDNRPDKHEQSKTAEHQASEKMAPTESPLVSVGWIGGTAQIVLTRIALFDQFSNQGNHRGSIAGDRKTQAKSKSWDPRRRCRQTEGA